MFAINKVIHFEAAHRLLLTYNSKCVNLHGHSYGVNIQLATDFLDSNGMVTDFSEIKKSIGHWIDENWDHATLLNGSDKELGEFLSNGLGLKIFYFGQNENPTAEVMSKYLFDRFYNFFPEIEISSIQVWETSSSSAEYSKS